MKIKQVETETALHIPGLGTLPKTLVVGSKTKYPSLQMELMEGGVGVQVTIGAHKGIIPWNQIKIALPE